MSLGRLLSRATAQLVYYLITLLSTPFFIFFQIFLKLIPDTRKSAFRALSSYPVHRFQFTLSSSVYLTLSHVKISGTENVFSSPVVRISGAPLCASTDICTNSHAFHISFFFCRRARKCKRQRKEKHPSQSHSHSSLSHIVPRNESLIICISSSAFAFVEYIQHFT